MTNEELLLLGLSLLVLIMGLGAVCAAVMVFELVSWLARSALAKGRQGKP